MSCLRTWFCLGLALLCVRASASDPGNRLTYLDSPVNPYYVHREMARLITPQWIGEEGVDAVIVLAIDDMSDAAKYEQYLRPILDRLKQIDGRASMSIMTQRIDPTLPQLKSWADEGVSVEAHTRDHPCPCLQKNSLDGAKATFDQCIDQLSALPDGGPVAFRMPCCDSMNSVSPRFFTELFQKTTPVGHFLTMDSSVFMLYTADDSSLPRPLVIDEDGREKFRKYLPTDRTMVNFVENYPYPFVIGRLCWEFPCLMPSDWVAQHYQGKCNPDTVRDFQAAVDATVLKQGVFSLCFHPHGWIRNDQVAALVDYADRQYGKRVKFLSFREVQRRLDEHLLDGQSLRTADGRDNGVRVLDLNADGFMDVVIGNPAVRATRVWDAEEKQWRVTEFPVPLVNDESVPNSEQTGVRFGVLHADGRASVLARNEQLQGVWHFDGANWQSDEQGWQGLELDGPLATQVQGRDTGLRLRDLDRDGICEAIVGNLRQNAVFRFAATGWVRLPFALPVGVTIVDDQGRDAGLRFVDFDEDGHDDVVFSNAECYSAHAFTSMQDGWTKTLLSGRHEDGSALPMIVRADGSNNGVWFSYGHMWVQNEETGGTLVDHVDRRSFVRDFATAGAE